MDASNLSQERGSAAAAVRWRRGDGAVTARRRCGPDMSRIQTTIRYVTWESQSRRLTKNRANCILAWYSQWSRFIPIRVAERAQNDKRNVRTPNIFGPTFSVFAFGADIRGRVDYLLCVFFCHLWNQVNISDQINIVWMGVHGLKNALC